MTTELVEPRFSTPPDPSRKNLLHIYRKIARAMGWEQLQPWQEYIVKLATGDRSCDGITCVFGDRSHASAAEREERSDVARLPRSFARVACRRTADRDARSARCVERSTLACRRHLDATSRSRTRASGRNEAQAGRIHRPANEEWESSLPDDIERKFRTRYNSEHRDRGRVLGAPERRGDPVRGAGDADGSGFSAMALLDYGRRVINVLAEAS